MAGPSVQLATIVGEPGVGKSRLVAELDAYIDSIPDLLVRIRKGRCLPYGEGITFWALGEIVKWAGRDPRDATTRMSAADKLDAIVPDVVADDATWWFGSGSGHSSGWHAPAPHAEESFVAWRRFLETTRRTTARTIARLRGPALGGRGHPRFHRARRRLRARASRSSSRRDGASGAVRARGGVGRTRGTRSRSI